MIIVTANKHVEGTIESKKENKKPRSLYMSLSDATHIHTLSIDI